MRVRVKTIGSSAQRQTRSTSRQRGQRSGRVNERPRMRPAGYDESGYDAVHAPSGPVPSLERGTQPYDVHWYHWLSVTDCTQLPPVTMAPRV